MAFRLALSGRAPAAIAARGLRSTVRFAPSSLALRAATALRPACAPLPRALALAGTAPASALPARHFAGAAQPEPATPAAAPAAATSPAAAAAPAAPAAPARTGLAALLPRQKIGTHGNGAAAAAAPRGARPSAERAPAAQTSTGG
jgi:hypothetical protein